MLNRKLCENPIWLFVHPLRDCSYLHECKSFTHSVSWGQPKAVSQSWQRLTVRTLTQSYLHRNNQVDTHKSFWNIFRITVTHSNTQMQRARHSSGRHRGAKWCNRNCSGKGMGFTVTKRRRMKDKKCEETWRNQGKDLSGSFGLEREDKYAIIWWHYSNF